MAQDNTELAIMPKSTLAESILKNVFKSENVTASFDVQVQGTSSIFAKRMGNILIVSGYINPSADIAINTNIATIDARPVIETFASPISSSGTGGRMCLRVGGRIQLEYALKGGQWYSFTFVTFVN